MAHRLSKILVCSVAAAFLLLWFSGCARTRRDSEEFLFNSNGKIVIGVVAVEVKSWPLSVDVEERYTASGIDCRGVVASHFGTLPKAQVGGDCIEVLDSLSSRLATDGAVGDRRWSQLGAVFWLGSMGSTHFIGVQRDPPIQDSPSVCQYLSRRSKLHSVNLTFVGRGYRSSEISHVISLRTNATQKLVRKVVPVAAGTSAEQCVRQLPTWFLDQQ